MTNMPRKLAPIMPANTGVPTFRRASMLGPTATTSGCRPRKKAKLVIITGRKRNRAPSLAASNAQKYFPLNARRKMEMNAKMAFAVAALFSLIAGEIVVGSPARATDESVAAPAFTAQLSTACAGGYHPDAQGNCQPNSGYVNTDCLRGFISEPFPSGPSFRCVPISASLLPYIR